jgi:DNA-binding MarR family transcriptional regulator
VNDLRGIMAVLILTVPVAAAPVPAPIRDEAVSPVASRMLRNDKVQQELRLTAEQHKAVANTEDERPAKLLTPAQRSRLRQLVRQVLGPAGFAEPDVQKALQLTDSQKALAADLAKQLDRRVAEYLAVFGNDDADNLKTELLAFRRSAMKQIDSTFRDEHRSLRKTLTGEPATAFDPDLYWLYVLVEERLRSR